MMSTYRTARRGSESLLLSPVCLGAGQLSVELIGAELFGVRWGRLEVAQRVYLAVRDTSWNTIPGELFAREIIQSDDAFRVTFRSAHRFESIDFEWIGVIEGRSDGTLTYEMVGEALAEFSYSKIGLNIHHGLAAYRGRSYVAQTFSGEVKGQLESDIKPQSVENGYLTAMFDYFDRISFDLDGAMVSFEFEGDQFEMQDQRNWSDANYKTYGTPLRFGFPREARNGESLSQKITMKVAGPISRRQLSDDAVVVYPRFVASTIPEIGQCWRADDRYPDGLPPSTYPDFLRVEVMDSTNLETVVRPVLQTVDGTDIEIELVVATSYESVERDSARVTNYLRGEGAGIARLVILERSGDYDALRQATPPELALPFKNSLRARGVETPVLSGTDQNFSEVNRSRPSYSALDGLAFPINPQVHACDDISLMQNAAGIVDIASQARRLYSNTWLSVGPVELIGKDGPYPAGPPHADSPPPWPDPRQGSLFGAAWAVAFLEACVRADVDALTLFDLTGDHGLVDRGSAEAPRNTPFRWVMSRLPQVRSSRSTWRVLPVDTDPRYSMLGWQTEGGSRALIANVQDRMLDLRFALGRGPIHVAILDETAQRSDTGYWDEGVSMESSALLGKLFPIVLRPYAVVCVDSSFGPSTGDQSDSS